MRIHITRARIINPDEIIYADICIENGNIQSMEKPGSLISGPGIKTIYAGDRYIIPGGIDPHVHLALPTPAGRSADDFLSGSRAALAGGVTHLIDFVTPRRGQDLAEAYMERKQESRDCLTPIDFHMGISGWLPHMEKQMEVCVKEHGIRSFKTYLAYRSNIGIGYNVLEKIMQIAARLDVIVLVHAEDEDMIDQLKLKFLSEGKTTPAYHALSRPSECESLAVKKTIELVRKTGCKTYFVHISAAESADHIAQAKKEGLPVFAETCPQYLVLDDGIYEGDFEATSPYVFSPPARPARHRQALWQHVLQGTFDTIGTDHCPFSKNQKILGKDDFTMIPNGAGGVEFRLPLIHHYGVEERGMPLQQWVQLMSTNAAGIFGLSGKGYIRRGAPADLVLFDPKAETTLSAATQVSQCDINIYEGIKSTGRVDSVITLGIEM
jgi:dihydropyrimidinase